MDKNIDLFSKKPIYSFSTLDNSSNVFNELSSQSTLTTSYKTPLPYNAKQLPLSDNKVNTRYHPEDSYRFPIDPEDFTRYGYIKNYIIKNHMGDIHLGIEESNQLKIKVNIKYISF
ncbi:hypothetical protein K502DRAFT_353628 [Neoconidiobolus thromboides FSU 785]|nr:hypothetical protein K502DRAFT_353628 [Neoconidiobolus thromboides FSU 785]